MQIYFIDNEDYFQRKHVFYDAGNKFFKDNDERAIFFARGVLETVKKLGWAPDIVHCHGWITSLLPIYLKKAFVDNPLFTDTKVVYSIYDDDFPLQFSKDFSDKIKLPGISDNDVEHYTKPTFSNITKAAIDFSDGVIIGSPEVNPEIVKYVNQIEKPVLAFQSMDTYIDAYNEFYDEILVNEQVLSN
jgi:starch synthase